MVEIKDKKKEGKLRKRRLHEYQIGEKERVLITKLQIKGFFDDLSDEIANAFCDKTFEYEFLRFLCEEKTLLKEELEREITCVSLIANINNNLKTKFTRAAKRFSKLCKERLK